MVGRVGRLEAVYLCLLIWGSRNPACARGVEVGVAVRVMVGVRLCFLKPCLRVGLGLG